MVVFISKVSTVRKVVVCKGEGEGETGFVSCVSTLEKREEEEVSAVKELILGAEREERREEEEVALV